MAFCAEQVMLLDVRTPEEFMFVGHAPLAWKIPVVAVSYEWDATRSNSPRGRSPTSSPGYRRWRNPTTR